MDFREQIFDYIPFNEQEERDKKLLIEWLSEPEVFKRKRVGAFYRFRMGRQPRKDKSSDDISQHL